MSTDSGSAPTPDPGVPADVTRLREQRRSLKRLTRDLMVWIGLLRHKAMSLRALSGPLSDGPPAGLTPGSLDPRALAAQLTQSVRPARATTPAAPAQQLTGLDVDEVIARARTLWETVADPADPQACQLLSEAADSLAAQLEVRVNEALDQYRRLGDEMVRSLRGVKRRRRADAGDSVPLD